MKNHLGEGLILEAINQNDKELFKWLIEQEIDIDYFTFIKSDSPIRMAIIMDILHNQFYYSKLIFKKVLDIKKLILEQNKNLDNLAHLIAYIRLNKQDQNINIIDSNYEIDKIILSNCPNECLNQLNDKKESPLMIISKLDWAIYGPILEKSDIKVSKDILDKIQNEKYLSFYKSLPEYKEENNIKYKEEPYTHSTMFQAKFKDVGIFATYLADKYKELYLPNMVNYTLNNLTWDDSFPFSDEIIEKEPVFPWIITWYNSNEYHIHPYLNNLINGTRRDGKKRFALVFLSIITDNILHANILIYDFKKMTVERFEPYGNTINIDDNMDEVLEEELCWNTGLTYIKPGSYLPWTGFQTISDEENPINRKAGDFGGFCLAWCMFYLENRLNNPDVNIDVLIKKLISKMSKSNNKFSEIIRNYANKINEKRMNYLKKIGIDKKEASNIFQTEESNRLILDWFISKFRG